MSHLGSRHALLTDNQPTPFTGGLSLFNLYVTLSRSSGRSMIRLLHNFDDHVFQAAHCPELLAENDRLEKLNDKTLREWRSAGRDIRNRDPWNKEIWRKGLKIGFVSVCVHRYKPCKHIDDWQLQAYLGGWLEMWLQLGVMPVGLSWWVAKVRRHFLMNNQGNRDLASKVIWMNCLGKTIFRFPWVVAMTLTPISFFGNCGCVDQSGLMTPLWYRGLLLI